MVWVGGQYLYLNTSLSYRVFLHDPSYFFITLNPLTIPCVETAIKRTKDAGTNVKLQYIYATKRIAINRADAPCEEAEDYSFTECIKSSVTKSTGCKTPWYNIPGLWQECQTVQQIMTYVNMYDNLSRMDKHEVSKITGCQPPCIYMEYVSIDEKDWQFESPNTTLEFGIVFATTEVTVRKEIYIYPFSSFLAEFGGALGFFLGFSFFKFWDFIKWILVKYILSTDRGPVSGFEHTWTDSTVLGPLSAIPQSKQNFIDVQ